MRKATNKTELPGVNRASDLPGPGRQRLLVAMVAACLPGAAAAEVAGSVDFAAGNVMVFYSNGNRETLTKGMTLSPTDSVRTGDRGIAHIRFTDGGYVSVQKNTIFRIDEYEYDGSQTPGQGGSTNRGFFSLLRGGFRAITGFLGASNYRVTTPVATIGIRGTEYYAELGRSLSFNVADGAIEVCNTAGCQFFRENEFGHIEDSSSLITRLRDMGLDVVVSDEQGETIATVEGEEDFEFKIAEEVNENGDPLILAGTAPSCALANCTAAFAWVDMGGTYNVQGTSNLTGVFENNTLVSFTGGPAGLPADSFGTTTPQAAGSTPDIAWGRWTGGLTSVVNQAVHYVVGLPTPNINSLTGTRLFTISGFTVPTTNTVTPLGAFNGIDGVLNADFDQAKVSFDFTVDFANADYRVSTFSFGSLPIGADARFGGTVAVSGGAAASISTTCSFGGCNGFVSGFFAGANADKAGLTYHIQDPGAGGDITGAAVFD